MNLRLYVSKNDDARDYYQRRHIRFAVVDTDKSESYPANYVCMLPLQPTAKGKAHNIFSEQFGNDSLELAKRLLTEALKAEADSEVKAEIQERLTRLEPKPSAKVKCQVCGKSFKPERRRFKQKICQECTRKKYASQK